jgi:hypothetical protein
MKIKTRYIVSIIAAVCLHLSAFSQTNPAPIIQSPVLDAFNFLSTPSSNWMFATYGIFTKSEGGGVGIGAAYKVSENFGAVLRLDRIGNDTYMPSGNFQIQAPVTLMGKVTVVPFAFTGIATPLNASAGHDGVVGVFGIGSAFRLPDVIKSKSRFLPDDVVYDYEKWTSYEGGQHRIGFLWKF